MSKNLWEKIFKGDIDWPEDLQPIAKSGNNPIAIEILWDDKDEYYSFESPEEFKASPFGNDPDVAYWEQLGRPDLYVKEFEDKDLGLKVFFNVARGGIFVEVYDNNGKLRIQDKGQHMVAWDQFCVVDNNYYFALDGVTVFLKA